MHEHTECLWAYKEISSLLNHSTMQQNDTGVGTRCSRSTATRIQLPNIFKFTCCRGPMRQIEKAYFHVGIVPLQPKTERYVTILLWSKWHIIAKLFSTKNNSSLKRILSNLFAE